MGSLLNRRLITPAATYRGAADFVQVGPAYVEPLKIIKVNCPARLKQSHVSVPFYIEGVNCTTLWLLLYSSR